MRKSFIASAALFCSALAVASAPATMADAATRHRVLVCSATKHKKTEGAALGAVAGGLLGNVVAGHGNKTEGTVLGAGVGAVAGHQIAKNKGKNNCRYVYKYY